ncbi:MAG: hypothetical protein KF841_06810 [Phycisphaerae bacterium]|nr:hypothetical protein [Phycisphaerae bacterium]
MNESLEQLSTNVRRKIVAPLDRLGSAIRRRVLFEGAALCFGGLVALCTVQFVLDRILALGFGPRVALLAIVLGVVVHQFGRLVIRPFRRRIDVNEVAAVVERKHRAYADRIVSAVAFATGSAINPHRNSPALVAELFRESLATFEGIRFDQILERTQFRRRLALAMATLLAATAAFSLMPGLMSVYLQRNWLLRDTPWPVTTRIVAEGFSESGHLRWPIGDELRIVARALEGRPSRLLAEFELASGARSERDMDRLGEDRFILDFGSLTQAMRFRFVVDQWGVDDRTEWYTVDAVIRPSIRSARVEIVPPAYSEQAPFVLEASQSTADVLRGSAVRIEAVANKPLARAVLKSRSDDQPVATVNLTEGTSLEARFEPERRATYYFDLLDMDGLDDRSPVTFSINPTADSPPKVRMTMPGVGEMVVSGAQLPIRVECEDNLGIESVELVQVVRPNGKDISNSETAESLPRFTARQTRYEVRHELPLAPLTLSPGDQITLYARGRDYQPPTPVANPDASRDATVTPGEHSDATDPAAAANLGESVRYTLRVVTAEELLAELGRRENEWRREFEQIIKAQEQLNRRVMDLRDVAGADALSAERSLRYGQEARTQRQQINRVRTVARQFQQIFDELDINGLATPQVRRRLQNGVLAPLRSLATSEIGEAAELLERLRDAFDDETSRAVEAAQTRIIRSMYTILADMLKWEGYNEAIALLREVVRLQQEVNEDTKLTLDREIERLFGGEGHSTTLPAGKE